MRSGTSNPMNGRRHGLTQLDARLVPAESDLRQQPAFRLQIRRSLEMHPRLAAIVAGIVVLVLVLFALARKPVYTAESLIYVEPQEVRVLNDGTSTGYDPSRYDSYLQQQVQTIQRADTLEAALAKMPPGLWSGPGESTASAVRRLAAALKAPERVLNSYQLAIDVSAASPEAAAGAANAITAAYLEQGRKDEHTRADQRLQLLTEERQRITADMDRDKTEQAALGASMGVANPTGEAGNPYDTQNEGLRSQLASAREAHDQVAAQLASVSSASGNGLDTAANEIIVTDPGLVTVRQTLSQRRAVLSDQMAGLTPANPVYKQDQEEIDALDRSINRATEEARQRAERQLQDKLRLDLRRTAGVEGRLNAQLAEQTAKATGAGPKLQRAAELGTDLQRLSTRYTTVDEAIRGLQLETGGPGQAHLALAARVPETPQPSRSKLILLLALPLGIFCGVAAAVIARKRDPRLYLAGDLQDALGFAPLAVLPDEREVSAAAYDEFLLRLAGGVEGAYRYGGARSFVFTPVSVSASVADLLPQIVAKLRQIGFRAACVSADELMPPAGPLLEMKAWHVLQSRDGSHLRDGVAATQLERLLQEFHIVLIQAPPLLGSALTEYAVRSADATILLVESTRTERTDVRRAAALLERLNPQGIGVVLDKMPLRYADAGFRAAVRAADGPLLRQPERLKAKSSQSKTAAPAVFIAPKPAPVETQEAVFPSPEVPVAAGMPATDSVPTSPPLHMYFEEKVESIEAQDGDGHWEAQTPNTAPLADDKAPAQSATTAVESAPQFSAESASEAREPAPFEQRRQRGSVARNFAPAERASRPQPSSEAPWAAWQTASALTATRAMSPATIAPHASPMRFVDALPPEDSRAAWKAWAQTTESPALPEGPGVLGAEVSTPVEAMSSAVSDPAPVADDVLVGMDEFGEAAPPPELWDEVTPAAQKQAPPLEGDIVAAVPASAAGKRSKFADFEMPMDSSGAEVKEVYSLSPPEPAGEELLPEDSIESAATDFEHVPEEHGGDSAVPVAEIQRPSEQVKTADAGTPQGKAAGSWFRRFFHLNDEPAAPKVKNEPGKAAVNEDVEELPARFSDESAVSAELPSAQPLIAADEEHHSPVMEEGMSPVETPPEDVSKKLLFSSSTLVEAAPAAGPAQPEAEVIKTVEEPAAVSPLSNLTSQTNPMEGMKAESPEPPYEAASGEEQSMGEQFMPPSSASTLSADTGTKPEAEAPQPERSPFFHLRGMTDPPVPVILPPEPRPVLATKRPVSSAAQQWPPERVEQRGAEPAKPLMTFPRAHSASPLMGTAAPAGGNSRTRGRRATDRIPDSPSVRNTQGSEAKEEHLRPLVRAAVTTPPPADPSSNQRSGLAKAATAPEGPPARASEGLTAMRTGAGLLKAVVRQEAALRAHIADAPPSSGQAPMSRRWAMLSRFERGDERDAESPEAAGGDTAAHEPGRDSRV